MTQFYNENKGRFLVAIFSLFLFGTSCINTKKAIYFNNISDTLINPMLADIEQPIQKADLLSISVSSQNQAADLLFNAPNFTTSTTASSNFSVSQTTGYLVDQEGNIQFPVLGPVHAAGLTKKQLTNLITRALLDRKQLVDPIVNVRFLNYRVTVLGEVARPSVLNIPNEKISLLEAIGLAGDLTIYAKRDNVLVIREVSGKKLIKRLNLNSTELLTSPYYYLQSNDIVYVEPNKARIASSERSQQLLPIILSALSFVAIIASYWRKN